MSDSGSGSNQRLNKLAAQLVAPPRGEFEGIPQIRMVAGDSNGQRVKGKVVIVTGANSPTGIGRASAHQFAQNGARAVYVCDYDEEHLATHKREIEKLYPGVDVHTRQFDAADEAAVEAVVKHAIDTYGRLDIFFANAGITGMPTPFHMIDAEDFMETMRVNLLSVFLAAKHAAPAMKITSAEKPLPIGSLIATASVAGLRSNAGPSPYSASKAGVVNLMQTVAWQMAGTGVRANAICPGMTETGMTAPIYEIARQRGSEHKVGQLNPLRRGAVADEIARVALFLGSDEASYVNGQGIAVCGGLSAGHPVVQGKLS